MLEKCNVIVPFNTVLINNKNMESDKDLLAGVGNLLSSLQYQYLVKLLTSNEDGMTGMQLEKWQSLTAKLDSYEALRSRLINHINDESLYLKECQRYQKLLESQVVRIQHIVNNLPKHCPFYPSNQNMPVNNIESQTLEKVTTQHQLQTHQLQTHQNQNHQLQNDSFINTKIPYLSISEFDAIPKYMKGRLNRERVNECIDDFNAILAEKYRVMRLAVSKMSAEAKKRYWSYKESETSEVKGKAYITESDIKSLSKLAVHFKLDAIGRNVLAICRHCGRFKEVRGGGHIRFVLNNEI